MGVGTPASKSCTGKIAYGTRRQAKNALKKIKAAGKETRGLSDYSCDYCGWFHIGHRMPHFEGPIIEDRSQMPTLQQLRKRPRPLPSS